MPMNCDILQRTCRPISSYPLGASLHHVLWFRDIIDDNPENCCTVTEIASS